MKLYFFSIIFVIEYRLSALASTQDALRNRFKVDRLLPSGLSLRTSNRTASSTLNYFFSLFRRLFTVRAPCDRLSWLRVSFRAHISYGIPRCKQNLFSRPNE